MMIEYKDIHTVCQTVGSAFRVQCGTETKATAAEIAMKTIIEEIKFASRSTNMDYQTQYQVIKVDSLSSSAEVQDLTEEQMIKVLTNDGLIQYIDIYGVVCKVWLSTMRVFK